VRVFVGGADPCGGNLRPPAGRCAEVNDALAGAQDVVAFVDLEELVGGAGAVAFLL
jgi:hypothetical protein